MPNIVCMQECVILQIKLLLTYFPYLVNLQMWWLETNTQSTQTWKQQHTGSWGHLWSRSCSAEIFAWRHWRDRQIFDPFFAVGLHSSKHLETSSKWLRQKLQENNKKVMQIIFFVSKGTRSGTLTSVRCLRWRSNKIFWHVT